MIYRRQSRSAVVLGPFLAIYPCGSGCVARYSHGIALAGKPGVGTEGVRIGYQPSTEGRALLDMGGVGVGLAALWVALPLCGR